MGLLDAIRNSLNPTGMQGLPNQLTPNAGFAKNLGGLLDVVMQSQPQYMENQLARQQLLGSRLQNQNAPIANQLANDLRQQQIQELQTKNQYLPQSLQEQIALQHAHSNLLGQQAALMPQKLDLQAGRLALDQQRFSPDQLEALKNWRNALANTAPQRALTSTGKSIVEQANVDAGLMPTGQGQGQMAPSALANAISGGALSQPAQAQPAAALPDSPENLSGQYSLLRQKQVTDADARKRNLYATNVEKTLDTIDPSVIAAYSGMQGKQKLAQDAALAAMGKAPPEYIELQSLAKTKIPMLTSQVRQFYGDSIQPSVREHLESLANTSTWQDPAIALKRFNDLRNILGTEMQTYRDALKSPAVYQGKTSSAPAKANYSQADIEHTAQKYGMTVDQVKQKLGIR